MPFTALFVCCFHTLLVFQQSQTSNFISPQALEPSEPHVSGSKVAQNIMFYENLATSSNLEVGPFLESPQSTPRGTCAQVPPSGPMKVPSLEVDSGDEMGGESTGDKTTAIIPSLKLLWVNRSGYPCLRGPKIVAPPDPGLYEPSQGAVVPYNPGESPTEGPKRSCATDPGAPTPISLALALGDRCRLTKWQALTTDKILLQVIQKGIRAPLHKFTKPNAANDRT